MKRTIEGMDFFSRFFHFKRIQSTNRMQKGNDMTTFLSVTQKFTCRLCSWYFSYTEKDSFSQQFRLFAQPPEIFSVHT